MNDLRPMLVIARRELLERIQSKWFVAITLLGPIGMVAMIILPVLLGGAGKGSKVDVIDKSGVLTQPLVDGLTAMGWVPTVVEPGLLEQSDDAIKQLELERIRTKQINGFLTVAKDAIDGGGNILYRGDNGSNTVVEARLIALVNSVVQFERGRRIGISRETLARVMTPAAFEAQQTSGETEGSSGAVAYFLGYLIAYILMLVIMLYAVGVMRSVVQEKTSRVMELMVATVKPRALMTGKILGVGGAGLIQIAVWLAMGAFTLANRDVILGWFGKTGGTAALPPLSFDIIAVTLGFFVLGYFFYASMYAAVGAMVSSEQDTQQVQMPITLLLLVGFACVSMVSGDPRGVGAIVVTMLPFWSALLMPMRYLLGAATVPEVLISLAILLASTVLIARAAAKIYRVGVLMYGKRPGLAELLRWLRY
ncbi:MAG: ABC transporter permease [Gemmatimonadetes bacterium]|nr:ABC transporter permease [Gemmatimonadota bacterium]